MKLLTGQTFIYLKSSASNYDKFSVYVLFDFPTKHCFMRVEKGSKSLLLLIRLYLYCVPRKQNERTEIQKEVKHCLVIAAKPRCGKNHG